MSPNPRKMIGSMERICEELECVCMFIVYVKYTRQFVTYKLCINVVQNMIFATGMGTVRRLTCKQAMFLEQVSVFNGIKGEYMELLESLFEPFSCSAGTTILKQGTRADYLYIVVSGKAEVSFKPYDGSPITISHVEKGGLFGWSAVVGSDDYTSSAFATEDLEAMRVRGSELRKLCDTNPEAAKEILERLAASVSSRWYNAYAQVTSILTNGMRKKQQDF